MSIFRMALDTLEKIRSLKPLPHPPDEWQMLPPLFVNEAGWLEGDGVRLMPSHASWFYPRLSTKSGDPLAIVAHCTDTLAGGAFGMAQRRQVPRKPTDRPASWHVTIEPDVIVQMVSFEAGAWHAPSLIPGVGSANRTAVGLELSGKPAGPWPDAQVAQYARVTRAIVQSYWIPRTRALISHQSLDPTRRSDPGRLFMERYAPLVIAYAFA